VNQAFEKVLAASAAQRRAQRAEGERSEYGRSEVNATAAAAMQSETAAD
jgi:hypothetical protein